MDEFDIRPSLARHLRDVANWRRSRYQDDLRDPRNIQSAAGLDELAEFVLGVAIDDPRLAALTRYASEGESFTPGQQALYEIGRFRFFDGETSCDAFLDQLADFARADHIERGHFGGRQVPGDDPWG